MKKITIDTHCDTPLKFIHEGFNIYQEHNSPEGRVNLPRMEKSCFDAVLFAMFTNQYEKTIENGDKIYKISDRMIYSTFCHINRIENDVILAILSSDAEKAIVQKVNLFRSREWFSYCK